VVATTDLMVEGRHFRRDWSSAADVGHKSAAANLADVAAMGATTTALLVALVAPPQLELDWVDGFVDGMLAECARVGATVAGGDLAAGDRIVVAVTALGDLRGRMPVTRAGARPGDIVVVAGRLGHAAAGLALLHAGHHDDPLCAAHRRPEVDYQAALRLADAGASAMIDVSDGLVADLGHLAEASGVGIELASDDLPLPAELVEAGLAVGVDPLSWVAGGGDDHAFAATMPSEAALRAVALLADLPEPVPIAQVGRVVERSRQDDPVVFLDATPPGPAGHEHFRL
jgi:thiamine-monophosphate kinase